VSHSLLNLQFESEAIKVQNQNWIDFLKNYSHFPYHAKFTDNGPIVSDSEGRKFQIDFIQDRTNYHKFKNSVRKEPLARALGAGQKGTRLLDMSAGLGIDAVFLSQLGFKVTALERNPLIFMCLKIAEEKSQKLLTDVPHFIFSEAIEYLKSLVPENFDVGYFDPMFPDKKKSALPRQEMVVFKNLVGLDPDALEVVEYVCQKKLFKRFVVKRPIGAETYLKPDGSIEGKIIRYDIYSSH